MKSYRLEIDGMTCEHCANHVTEALLAVAGVCAATVDLPGKTALVVLDESQSRIAVLTEAIRAAGFSIRGFRESPPPGA